MSLGLKRLNMTSKPVPGKKVSQGNHSCVGRNNKFLKTKYHTNIISFTMKELGHIS